MVLLRIFWRIRCFIKKTLLKIIFRKRFIIGKNSHFRKNFCILLEKGGEIVIGDNCFFNRSCSINCLGKVEIGRKTIFGENVKIYDHNHRFGDGDKFIREQGYSVAEVRIGKNCWIGSNAVILKGVTIGDNCVIGAGCIVNQDIPADSLVKPGGGLIIEAINYKK